MARVLLLWCAGAAAFEYGARAPLYDEHAPDYQHAPALDYKYEEHARGKTNELEIGEATEIDPWPRPGRKHSRRTDENLDLEDMGKIDHDDEFARPKPFNRFTRYRSRIKSRKFDRNDYSSRYGVRNRHVRNDDNLENDEELTVDDEISHDNSRRVKNDRAVSRMSSERVVRRKPRDEYARRRSEDEENENAEASVERELQAWNLERGEERRPAERQPHEDYYDMKRVLDIKSQLPALMRRTQARPLVPAPLRRPAADLLPNRRPAADLLPNRRMLEPEPPRSPPTTAASSTPLEDSSRASPTISTSKSTTSQPLTDRKSTLTVNGSKELSLAEKSRLSILKKVQRKESVRSGAGTSKPPVLLQVTAKMPTVVVVEPPTSAHPWLRARTVGEDSPRRLRRVKQLMRHKLLAGARSINDLTDNWDELVCDYVDLSLLDRAARPLPPILSLCSLAALLLLYPLFILG